MTARSEKLSQPNGQINFFPLNSIHTENASPNQLQKYRVVKMISSGDYVCTDRAGNTYLLVCQPDQSLGGVQQFREGLKSKFHRSSTNRALLTPFEDIEHNGIVFTVFMIPEMAENIMDASLKSKSEIFCLSILFSFINKVLKPLIEIFDMETSKWLHGQNIWIKQNTIYYVLSKRKIKKTNLSFSPDREKSKSKAQSTLKSENQKKLLRLLCNILIPYFKIDHQLKSFQSIVFDSMLNEQFKIDQIVQLLNDRKKRKQFINERKQEQVNAENHRFEQILKQNGQFWRKKRFGNISENRRQLKSFSQNVRGMYMLDIKQEQKRMNRNKLGQTINVPPSFQTRRNSLAIGGLFDFRERSKRKNKSVSEQKSTSRYHNSSSGQINLSQQIQQTLRSHVKYYKTNAKQHSVNVNVKQRAFRKFTESIPLYDDNKPNQATIDEKQLRSYLLTKEKIQNPKSKTIDVGDLKQKQIQRSAQNLISSYHQSNGQTIARKLKIQQQKSDKIDSAKQNEKKIMVKEEAKQKIRFSSIQSQKSLPKHEQQIKKEQINQTMKQKQRNLESQQQEKKKLPRNSSEQLNNKNIYSKTQKIDLEEIQMIPPKIKQQVKQISKQQVKQISKQQVKPTSKTNILPNPSSEIINKPPLPKPIKEKILTHNHNNQDQLEEVILIGNKKQGKNRKSSINSVQDKQKQKQKVDLKLSDRKTNQQAKNKQETESNKRVKTTASEIPSACGPKRPVSKQVNEYMHMINKMGESVAKSSRISEKLEGIEWFTGIYFIYKRFLFERKNVEKWLEKNVPNITRYAQKNKAEWDQWFASEQKKDFQTKLKAQNENIVTSIVKMNKKMGKKKLHPTIARHIPLSQHHQQQSKIAVSQIIQQYDTLDQKNKLKDEEVVSHVNDLLNSIYIIAELDGKFIDKKPLAQIFKKRNTEELSEYSDFLYQLYIQEQQQE